MGGVRCAAKECKNCMKNNKEFTYHRFPSMKHRCIEWLKACGRHDLLNAPIESIYRNFRICSVHFETKMYCNPEKTRLLPQAVPTLFNHNHELTSISDQKPDESAYNYEEPQRTSTPTVSENVHYYENLLISTTDESNCSCSTTSTSSQTPQKLSVNTPRKKKLKTEVSLLKSKCAKLKKQICFKRPKLRVGAVPTISLTPLLCDSNLLTISHEPDTLETVSISETICAKNDELNLFEKEKNVKDIQNDHCYHSSYSHMSSSVVPESTISSKLKTSPLLSKRKKTLEIKPATALFINILKNIKLVSLPSKWYAHFDFVRGITNDLILGFHQLSSFGDGFQRSIKKQIVMTKDSTLHIHVYGSKVTMEDIGLASNKPKNIEELVNIIKHVDKVKVCERSVSINNLKNIQSTFGSQFIQSYQWRHTNCSIILDNDSKRNVCKWCKRLLSKVENKLQSSDIVYISPSKRKRIENLQKTKDQIKKKYSRATVKLSKLKNNLNNKKNKRKETSHINMSSTLESSNIQK